MPPFGGSGSSVLVLMLGRLLDERGSEVPASSSCAQCYGVRTPTSSNESCTDCRLGHETLLYPACATIRSPTFESLGCGLCFCVALSVAERGIASIR